MADECINYRKLPATFPRRPNNRPALPHIAYRIGQYTDFREAILRQIDAFVPLRQWTHRAPDDPGVSLLEGAAIIGDILTFYQEHYANEAYLRTASWRESVSGLLRLLGYRLAPGLGGNATFAFEVKGADPVVIPQGLPIKAELNGPVNPGEFQTLEALTAYSHLSKFHLYRPRIYSSIVAAGANTVELQSVDGSLAEDDLEAVKLKSGDKILLMPSETMWSVSGTNFSRQARHQILKIKDVSVTLGRHIITFEDDIVADWSSPVRAFRVTDTLHHWGHNAPPTYTQSIKNGDAITGAKEFNTKFIRDLDHSCGGHGILFRNAGYNLDRDVLPLDSEIDIGPGTVLVIEAQVPVGGVRETMVVARTVTGVESKVLTLGSLNGRSSVVTLSAKLLENSVEIKPKPINLFIAVDLRDFRIFRASSPELRLRPRATASGGPFTSASNALFFFGMPKEAGALAGRRLLACHDDSRTLDLVCVNSAGDFASVGDDPQAILLNFDRNPTPFNPADFDEEKPGITVYGNIASATQGKAEPDAELGNGDSRLTFQTFKIPKKPLTYLFSAGATPPSVPQVDVYVSGRKWTRVESFYGASPLDEIFIVREDADGNSFVQFGDGETGARLPSGLKNVVAKYRSGLGASGPLRPNTSPSSSQRVDGMTKIHLLTPVTGGAEPEDPEKSRVAGPGRVQSLGRLVSLRDYETELLSIGGVTSANARWGLLNNVPSVLLTVLLEAGREAEFSAVRTQIEHARQCRGPNSYPVSVQQAFLRFVFLDLEYAADPALLIEDVEEAIRAALGLFSDDRNERSGLFGLHSRVIGDDEYATRVEGVVQQAMGVRWCAVKAFGMFLTGVQDPADTPLPATPRALSSKINCPPGYLLQLHKNHLTLLSVATPAEACS